MIFKNISNAVSKTLKPKYRILNLWVNPKPLDKS